MAAVIATARTGQDLLRSGERRGVSGVKTL
jgi:hypothetical protein